MIFKWIFLIVGILLIMSNAEAQYDNVWVFGNNAGLDFKNAPPTPIKTAIHSGEGCASICDENGNLLFYTEGSYIWNRNHDTMPNGKDLTGLWPNGSSATESSTQGALIVPVPGSSHKYYVLSLSAWTSGPPPGTAGRLYFSIVDLNLDNGMGDVEPGSKGIFIDSNFTEEMTAVVGEQCNVWLIMHNNAGYIYAYEINENEIRSSPVQSAFPTPSLIGSSLKISPGRKKIVAVDGSIRIGDFNAETGAITNVIALPGLSLAYSAEFSPDDTKLYTNQRDSLVQFDISSHDAAAIQTSKKGIAALDGPDNLYFKLGPDNKIYFQGKRGAGGNVLTLSRINFPNLSGSASQYEADAITLLNGTRADLGLPNVVPIIKRDTVQTLQTETANPFAIEYIMTANDVTGWDYNWNDGSSGSQKTTNVSGKFWVSYFTAPCNLNIDTFLIDFPCRLPEIDITASCQNAINGKARVIKNPEDTVTYHYIWRDERTDILSTSDSVSGLSSGSYTLQISTPRCDTILFITIPEVNYHVSFTADSIVCEGEEVEFQNTSDNHFNQFSWDFGDTNSSSLPHPSYIYEQAGRYEVMLAGIGQICKDTTRQIIVVDPKIEAYFVRDKDSICVGESVAFTHGMDKTTVTHLNWQMGDGNDLSVSDNSLMHAYERAGTMPVTLRSQFRVCPESAFTDTVYVFDLPKVDLGADTSVCLHGTPVILKNRFLSSNPQRFLWSTGDTSEMLKIVHPGTYSLKIGEAPLGCSNTETIEIKKACYLDIPNAFTPNGDGENDYFFPRQLLSKKITQFHMKILNRWGQVVFETENVNGRGWDGKFNEKEQPGGVYVYFIDVEIDGLNKERYQGNVTLIK